MCLRACVCVCVSHMSGETRVRECVSGVQQVMSRYEKRACKSYVIKILVYLKDYVRTSSIRIQTHTHSHTTRHTCTHTHTYIRVHWRISRFAKINCHTSHRRSDVRNRRNACNFAVEYDDVFVGAYCEQRAGCNSDSMIS